MNGINYIKYLVYLSVLYVVFPLKAGSFDDFFIAIKADNAGVVNELLARGFDPNTRDPGGQPGLTIAIRERSLKAARALLDHPTADINALNDAGESALMVAALKGDLAAAKLLVERGAKVDQAGWAPIHYAATGPEPKLLQLLLDRDADVNAGAPNGTTALMMAARYGSEDSVKLLLERGADPKRRNERELGAADFARLAGREPLAKWLDRLQR